MKPELKVGDKLYFVSHKKYMSSEEVVVLKVGRKWATLDNDTRIDLSDLVADGGEYMSPGRCYTNKKEYDDECELDDKWEAFYEKLGRSPPNGMTLSKISDMEKMCWSKT